MLGGTEPSVPGAEAGSARAVRADAAELAPVVADRRTVLSLGVVLAGMLLARWWFGEVDPVFYLWFALGLGGGAIAGTARRGWIAAVAAAAFYPLTITLGLAKALGPFWYLQAVLAFAIVGSGFAIGATTDANRRPWRVARTSWRGARGRSRTLVVGLVLLGVAGLGGYVTYAGLRGSGEFIRPAEADRNCTTPADPTYGWPYEAINYDIADDAVLAAANPDPTNCSSQGASAGSAVLGPGGVPIAGWYIPAGNGTGPAGPTILIVHGWHSNKSGMLPYAAPLHERFNLVLVDLRNDGRSGAADVTMGVRESGDLEAMVDWLVATKHPTWIGALGNSMGGATVLAAASRDDRIRAVLLESTHAELVISGGNIIENEHGFPAQPSGWATIWFTSARLGLDVLRVDPERTIRLLGKRPVLLVHSTGDRVDYPATSADLNFRAAIDAGVPAELAYCQGGKHGDTVLTCPALWSRWANDFFAAAAGV